MMLVLINFLLPVNYDTCMRLSRYRVLKNSCNTVLDLSAQCFPYMEDSELSAFLIWKVQSSVPSLYGMFTVGYTTSTMKFGIIYGQISPFSVKKINHLILGKSTSRFFAM